MTLVTLTSLGKRKGDHLNIEQPLSDATAQKVSVQVPNDDAIQNWFTYHPPTDETIPKYHAVRDAGLAFARVIMASCPPGADTSTAIRKVREAVMTANAAIACCGKP